MQKKKLFSLLRTLESRELIAFKNFLERRYPETRTPISVFDYLRKFHPHYKDETRLSQEAVHQKLFGQQLPHGKKMLNLYSDLYLDLQDFLLFKKVKEDGFESKQLWLSVLEERKLTDAYFKEAEQLVQIATGHTAKTDLDYLKSTSAAHLRCYKTRGEGLEKGIVLIQQYDQALDLFYAVGKLKSGCEMKALNRLHDQKFDDHFMPLILQICSQVKLTEHPLLHLYLEVYHLVQQQTEQNFKQTSALFKGYLGKIASEEMCETLEYLLHFCNVKVSLGSVEYWDEAWDLIKEGHKNHIFEYKGALNASNFNNLVLIACRKKEFNWAAAFIETQGRYLGEKNNEAALFLAKITLDFERGLYEKVIAELDHKKFRKVTHVIRAKSYVLMCQYVLQSKKQDLDVSNLCNTFEAYLRRHQIKYTIVKRFMDFTKILKMLSEKKEPKDKIQIYLQSVKQVASREWLEQMLEVYKPEIWGGMER